MHFFTKPQTVVFFAFADLIFLLLFTVELWMRIHVWAWRSVLTNPVYQLDAFIVTTGLVSDILIPIVTGRFSDQFQSGGSISDDLKLLKSLRALRAFRVLRMLSFFQDLWLVVLQFGNSLR